jgi:hypothetical protein
MILRYTSKSQGKTCIGQNMKSFRRKQADRIQYISHLCGSEVKNLVCFGVENVIEVSPLGIILEFFLKQVLRGVAVKMLTKPKRRRKRRRRRRRRERKGEVTALAVSERNQ